MSGSLLVIGHRDQIQSSHWLRLTICLSLIRETLQLVVGNYYLGEQADRNNIKVTNLSEVQYR